MSASTSIVSYDLGNLRLGSSHHRSQASVLNSYHLPQISTYKNRSSFLADRGLLSLSVSRLVQLKSSAKMNMTVYSSVQPSVPIPPGPLSDSRLKWILGFLLSIILPFWRNKWGPLAEIKKEVDTVMEVAEHVAEVVEQVAEEVEKVADDIADKLPEGGKLREAICFVENVAEKAAKDANILEDVIEKVEEMEKEVESFMEPAVIQENVVVKEGGDQK